MKLKQKLMATILTVTMLMGYVSTLESAVIAAGVNLTGQNSKTNHANVEMNSYFAEENHSQTFEIGKTAKVFFRVKVSNTGYLKNTNISLNDSNYEFVTEGFENEQVQSITSNQIKLKQINATDEEVIIEVPIQILKTEETATDILDSISTVKITGTYIDGNGKEKQIEKEIQQQVKWKTMAEVEMAGEISKFIPYHEAEEYGIIMQAKITSSIKDNILPVKNTKLEITLPKITVSENTVEPTRVSVVANSTIATNGINNGDSFNTENYYYDAEKNVIVIETKNEVNSEGKIAWNQGKDEYIVTYTFVGKEIYDAVNNQLAVASETKVTEEEKQAGKKNENAIAGEILVKAAIQIYQTEEQILEKEGKLFYTIEEKQGNIVDFSMTNTDNISKGYIYANYAKQEAKKENKQETTYNQTYYAQIYDFNINEGIEFKTSAEKLTNGEEETAAGKNIITKKISITEDNFKKMLGEVGKIEITNTKGTLLGIIDKNTESKDGKYTLDISEQKNNEVIIKTSAPVAEGKLEIKLEKAFTTTQTYTKEEMKNFCKMIVETTAKTNTNTENLQKEITLTEPVSKAELSIGEGKQNLSAVLSNKDVSIRVVLDTSSVENALYKNPVIEIQMPTQIKKVDIKSANLLLEDELKIKETKVVAQNGRQIIQITLEGTQTDYYAVNDVQQNNVIAKGANIILNTDITLNPLSASKTEEVIMYYINENTELYEETYTPKARAAQTIGITKTGITIVGQNEVVTASGISNYATGKEEILSAAEGTTNATIDTYTDKKVATISGKIINNYANVIKDVVILGRFPAKDNKKIDTTESFGSTFSTSLNSEITLTGINADKYTIYYSNKLEASKDLTDTNNGWTTTATSDAKSYMIVVSPDYELASETELDFSYNVEIPQNLSYNQSSYTMYKIYYTNVSETGTKTESKISHIIGMTTGTGPNIEISLKSATDTVREGQIVKMTATIKNTGGIKAENAKLLITAPAGTVHTEIPLGMKGYVDHNDIEKVILLGNINPGETITQNYELRIKKGVTIEEGYDPETGEHSLEEKNEYPGDKEIQNIVRISADNMSNEMKSESNTLKVLEGDLSITNTPNINETEVLQSGDSVRYVIEVKNISYDKDLTNVKLNITLPEGVKINDIYYGDTPSFTEKKTENITTNGNIISINLGTLQSFNKYIVNFIQNESSEPQIVQLRESAYVFMELELDSFSGEHEFMMTAIADGIETHYSNSKKLLAETARLIFEQQELDNQYIKEGTEYTYHFIIENVGKINSISNQIEMVIPNGLSLVRAEYTYQNKTKSESIAKDGKFTVNIYSLAPGGKIDLAVKVKANLLSDKNDKEVITMATLTAQGIEAIKSNKVKVIIEYDESAHQSEQMGQDTTTSRKYKITGTAWVDANKDGKRDDTEELLSGIQVLLLYKLNSQLVKDEDTGVEKITTTNESGTYQFTNLKADEYLVLFLYDAGKYSITDYQKEGVAETVNSDATCMKIVLDSEQRYAGVTDTIKISNSNERDVDIGLYVSKKFDLKLDKYISKITVTTPTNGKKVYNYNNSKLTKHELYGKDVGSSSIVAEYKIVVTNEGQVEGYAKKIIDYLPQDAKFNSELNKDWYLADSTGVVYNSSLANEKIMPGQTKEVTLVLTYSITEKNIGKLINNNAEIYESYNELGLEDIDSIVANRLESEDDMSSADIMLSVATGRIILYTTFILGIIALLGFGIYEIRKRVLIKKNN